MRAKLILALMLVAVLVVSGCSPRTGTEQEPEIPESGTEEVLVEITAEQLSAYAHPLDEVDYPRKRVIALGEATHGNRELTQLKLEVFQQLVQQQNMRVFAIEGDFGGAAKVNTYIQGGGGTAGEAVSEIGFAIYRTEEMAELVEWMRTFNLEQEPEDRIRFYGYDMQRFDNNLEVLTGILQGIGPQWSQAYRSLLVSVTDETMYDLEESDWTALLSGMENLNGQLGALENSGLPEQEYVLALQYAEVIRQNLELRQASNYGTMRDRFMAYNVDWLLEYEAAYYNNNSLFLTGHNSHIGKSTATFGTEACMGELLSQTYGSEYFAVGTELYQSTFLAADAATGERNAYTVINQGNKRLALLLHELGWAPLYLDIAAALEEPELDQYLHSAQAMTAIGDSFLESHAASGMLYTQQLAPADTYDGVIFLDTIGPSTMLEQEEA